MEKTTDMSGDLQDAPLMYEVSYILLPTLSHEQVETNVAGLKAMIQSAQGTLIADENPVMIDLAYSMTKVVGTTRHKCVTGYFGWMKFDMSRGTVGAVKKALDAHDSVLRYLIIKTVRENTLLNGKMMLKKEDTHDTSVSEEDVVEVSDTEATAPEAIDKSIDELVIA